jgi:hypothetical protein
MKLYEVICVPTSKHDSAWSRHCLDCVILVGRSHPSRDPFSSLAFPAHLNSKSFHWCKHFIWQLHYFCHRPCEIGWVKSQPENNQLPLSLIMQTRARRLRTFGLQDMGGFASPKRVQNFLKMLQGGWLSCEVVQYSPLLWLWLQRCGEAKWRLATFSRPAHSKGWALATALI